MSRSKCKGSSDVAGTTILFKVLHCKMKMFSLFCMCFLCIIFMKNIINVLQYSTVDIKMVVLIVYLD